MALRAGQIVFAVIAVLALTAAGRAAARRLGQDRVIGEIVVGLLVAPTILLLAGPELPRRLLPAGMISGLKVVAEVGLVLFLVGVTHKLDIGLGGVRRRAVGWVALGAFVPALCLGAGLGGWLVHSADPAVRGGAPAPAFVVFMAVAMAITAVPVLARILLDRGMADSAVGRVSLAAAILADSVGWLILSIAVSLNVSRAGRRLVPLYFGVTGFLVFASVPSVVSWGLVALVLALGIVGKVGGATSAPGWPARTGGIRCGSAP